MDACRVSAMHVTNSAPEGLPDGGEGQDDVEIAPHALDQEGEESGRDVGDALFWL